jgi:hypothetical protein
MLLIAGGMPRRALRRRPQQAPAAVKICGNEDCSPRVLARLHRDLGVVLSAGFNDSEGAKEEFILALRIDPTIGLDKAPQPDTACSPDGLMCATCFCVAGQWTCF